MIELLASKPLLIGVHLWELTIAILLVAFINRIIRNRYPHLAYALWIVVLVKSLLPPFFDSPRSLYNLVENPFVSGNQFSSILYRKNSSQGMHVLTTDRPEMLVTVPTLSNDSQNRQSKVKAGLVSQYANNNISDLDATVKWLDRSFSFLYLVIAAWFASVIILSAIVFFVRHRALNRLMKNSSDPPRFVVDTLRHWSSILKIERSPTLVISTEGYGPATVGILNPIVVIPESLCEKQYHRQLEVAIAHELTHVRRKDGVIALLQICSQLVWWFNPLIWWVNKSLSAQREICCDKDALRMGRIPPADYAQTILDLLVLKPNETNWMPGMGISAVAGIDNRLRNIMLSESSQDHHRLTFWLTLLFVMILIFPSASPLQAVATTNIDNSIERQLIRSMETPSNYIISPEAIPSVDRKEELDRFPIFVLYDHYQRFHGRIIDYSAINEIRLRFNQPTIEDPKFVAFEPIRYTRSEVPAGMKIERTPFGDRLNYIESLDRTKSSAANDQITLSLTSEGNLVINNRIEPQRDVEYALKRINSLTTEYPTAVLTLVEPAISRGSQYDLVKQALKENGISFRELERSASISTYRETAILILENVYSMLTDQDQKLLSISTVEDKFGQRYVVMPPIRYRQEDIPKGYYIHRSAYGDRIVAQEPNSQNSLIKLESPINLPAIVHVTNQRISTRKLYTSNEEGTVKQGGPKP